MVFVISFLAVYLPTFVLYSGVAGIYSAHTFLHFFAKSTLTPLFAYLINMNGTVSLIDDVNSFDA